MKNFDQFSKNIRINESEIKFINENEFKLADIIDSIKTHLEEADIYAFDIIDNKDDSYNINIEGDSYNIKMEGTNIIQKSKHDENTFKNWDELFGWWMSFVPQYKQGEAEHKLGESLTDDDTVEFTEDVECETFADSRQKGKIETIKKGEEADIFSVPDKGEYVGVQLSNGSIAWIDKKFLKKI